MHIVFNGLARAFFRRLEQRADIHIKAQIGKSRGHHFGTAVVPVLPQLGDHHARAAALLGGESGDIGFEGVPVFHGVSVAVVGVIGGGIHAGHFVRIGAVAAKGFFQSVAHLAYGGAQPHGGDAQLQQIAFVPGGKCQRVERGLHGGAVAAGAYLLEAGDLAFAYGDVVDVARIHHVFGLELVFVDADDDVFAAVNARLFFSGGGFDLQLGPATVHGLDHAAHGVDFFDDFPGGVRHVLRQLFHHVAASPRVDHAGDVGFFLDDELGVARNARAELGGQRDGLVKAVGVQALRAAKHRRHGLDGGAHHVVVGVLFGQAPAAGLAVGAQHQAFGRFGARGLHDAAPQQARGAHLGNL